MILAGITGPHIQWGWAIPAKDFLFVHIVVPCNSSDTKSASHFPASTLTLGLGHSGKKCSNKLSEQNVLA